MDDNTRLARLDNIGGALRRSPLLASFPDRAAALQRLITIALPFRRLLPIFHLTDLGDTNSDFSEAARSLNMGSQQSLHPQHHSAKPRRLYLLRHPLPSSTYRLHNMLTSLARKCWACGGSNLWYTCQNSTVKFQYANEYTLWIEQDDPA
jgi:hypothetical protein